MHYYHSGCSCAGLYSYQDEGMKRSLYFWRHAFPIYAHYRFYQIYMERVELPVEKRNQIYEKLHEKHAPDVFAIVLSLKGFYIKLAQAGSTRADFLPSQYLTRAVKLQDEAPSRPVSEIKDIISHSFQTSWDNLFSCIDPKPLGAASIGQAHRAILKDTGEEVAVKVQHPDAEKFFRADIKTIKAFCRYFQPAHLPYLEEVEKQFMTEFDYHEEALNLNMVRNNLVKSPFASRVVLPKPKIELCTKEVLVMEYLRGKKLLVGIQEHLECIAEEKGMSLEELRIKQREMDEERIAKGLDITSGPTQLELKALALQRWIRLRYIQLLNCIPGNWVAKTLKIDCDKDSDKKLLNVPSILKLLMDVHGYEIFVNGCFNGDPHPGNILLLEDGRIGLIDYGQVKRISLEHRIKLAKLTVALAEGSKEDIVHALTVGMGVRSAKMNPYFLEKQARLMFDRDDLSITEGRNVQNFVEYLDLIDQIVEVPDEYIMAFRTSLLLRGFSYALHYRHVFECRINSSDLMEEKRWKIYRRYRHFENLVVAAETVSEIVLPKLSKRYIDCFKTTRNEDRLLQLRTWLGDVAGRIGRYYQTGKEFSSERTIRCDTHQNIQSSCSSPTHSLASLLASFLLSGANVPIPSYIPRLPAFALSAKEINIQLFKRPMYPSKVRSSCILSGGLGIRLAAASKCQRTGGHIGATVYGFLCENSLVDSELTHVPVGSQLILINGRNVRCQNFDDILNELQSVALPLRLRFSCVPVRSLHHLEVHNSHTKPYGTTNRLRILHERNVKDNVNCQSTIAQQYLQQNKLRRDQNARSQTAFSILGSVFTELIGMKGTKMRDFFYGKKKKSPSWDHFGAFEDTFTTGFFTFLPSSLQNLQSNPSHNNLIAQDSQRLSDPGKNTDDKRGEIGVWSTTEGGHQLSLCIGHVGDSEAGVLEKSLKTLDKKEVNPNVDNREQSLKRGYVLVSINGESTFGKRFSRVVEMLIRASRPTTLCFRVFQDYKPLFGCIEKDDTEFYVETVLQFLSEAHRDMTNSLQVAMVENAAIRAKCDSIEQAVWKLESFACKETELLKETQRKLDAARDENLVLHNLLRKRDNLINELQDRSQYLETKLKQSQHTYEISAERARSQAREQIANQEAKLLNESNKSIELLHRCLEEKFTREKVLAIQRLKSQHGEYLQKLAEEHSEEVESLNQQVAVWRHQVDVLTEAERRTYLTRHQSLGHMHTPRCVEDSTLTNSTASNIRESRHLVHSAKNDKACCKCEDTGAALHKGANTSITTRWQFNEGKSASTTPGSSTESNEDSLLSEVKEDYMESRRAKSNMETSRNCSTLTTIWNRVVSIVS
uniref:Glycoside hydrolase putative n=1 Tax=Albugo laibachii Nc14 TaxID=890382 RepID=F0X064_9STRA|nr:glycoside hydrolase putative [Albugo laibachii Nc14]|eukprot:CCA27146.1 glycoside hydrolase putative [Albugo laibachii Nc14]